MPRPTPRFSDRFDGVRGVPAKTDGTMGDPGGTAPSDWLRFVPRTPPSDPRGEPGASGGRSPIDRSLKGSEHPMVQSSFGFTIRWERETMEAPPSPGHGQSPVDRRSNHLIHTKLSLHGPQRKEDPTVRSTRGHGPTQMSSCSNVHLVAESTGARRKTCIGGTKTIQDSKTGSHRCRKEPWTCCANASWPCSVLESSHL